MSGELKLVRRGLGDRVTRARRVIDRATGWPLAVRLLVFAAALAAELFAYPLGVFTGNTAPVMLAAAALPALWPRSAAVSAFWLLTAAGWVAATTLYESVATLPRLVGVAVALYAVHSAAALAAVLPYDAVVDPAAVARWLLRMTMVAAVSVGLAVPAMLYVGRSTPRSYLIATLAGLAVTAAMVWLIARAANRRS